MNALLMPVPKQQYFAIAGIPLIGGKVYTFAAGTSTPKATYSDSAATIPQSNPIVLNGRGEPKNAIYWSGNYRVEIRDGAGRLIYSVDNYNTDPNGTAGLTGSNGASLIGYSGGTVADALNGYSVRNIASLRALDKNKVSRSLVAGYYAPSDGGGGLYCYDSGDNTTDDNGGSVIVGTDGGRWKLQHNGSIVVEQFGAKGDGATDDLVRIQAAMDCKLIVNFSRKRYLVSGSIVLPDSVWVVGNGCVVVPTTAATVFTTAASAQDIHLHGIQVVGTTPNFGAFVIDAPRTWMTECTTTNVANGVVSRAASFYMSDCDIRATGTALTFETKAEVRSVESCILTSAGTCVVINGGADLRIVNCDLLAGNLCMLVNPTSGEVSSLKVIGVFFDQGVQGGIKILPTGTGTCRRFTFDSYWFTGSTSGDGVSAIGNIAGLMFSHGEVYGNSGNGFSFGAGVTSVTITGSHIAGNGSRGITAGNMNGLTITGNTIGPAGGYPGNLVGVEITGSTDNYMITGNRIGGNGTNIADGGAGVNKLISNNL